MKIHDVAQRSQEWFRLRLGIPTASKFSEIIKSDGKPSASRSKYAMRLAAELYAGEGLERWGGNIDMARGSHLEDQARAAYQFDTDSKVTLAGFITDDDCTVGASPDFLINEDGVGEIKCINTEDHLKAIIRWQTKREIDPAYVQQVQGEMWIAERQWCDLIFFHPALPMLVCRQTPIPAVVDGLKAGIAEVLKERDLALQSLQRQSAGAF